MNDTYTRMLAMFAAAKVKAEGGNEMEAKTQLVLWMAAGLRHRQELLQEVAVEDVTAVDEVPMFGWIVVGHRWDLYIGFVEDRKSGAVVSFSPYYSFKTVKVVPCVLTIV